MENSNNRVKIDISEKLLRELFNLADLSFNELPEDKEFSKLINTLKKKILLSKDASSSKGFKSVLVIDDLGIVVYQMSLLLTKAGHNVMLARTTEEAIHIFEKNISSPFDTIVMDLMMPTKEEGFHMLKLFNQQILDNNLNTKIIVMSGTKDKEIIKELENNGADHFIEKSEDWKMNILNIL